MVTRIGVVDDLEARTFTPISGEAAAAAAEQAAQGEAERAQESELLDKLQRGTVSVMVGLLRAVRARISIKLPEIKDEWTDEVLQAPGAALVPVLKRYASSVMDLLGANPELAGLAIACAPLAMGYVAAVERHRETIDLPSEPAP